MSTLKVPILAVTPAVLFLLVLGVIPFFLALRLSTLNYAPLDPEKVGQFVGLANYLAVWGDTTARSAMATSIVFSLVAVPLEVAGGLIVALWLWNLLAERRALLALVLLPAMLSPLVVGLLWKLLLQSEFGIGTFLLRRLGLWGPSSLLAGPGAFAVIIAVDLWQWLPFVAGLLSAALASLPRRLLEMARIDGASRLTTIRHVVLPYLVPALAVVSILRLVDAMREFEKTFVLTGGGPGLATELFNIYIWRTAFREWNMGYASALSIVAYVASILLAFTFVRAFALWRSRSRAFP